MQIDCDNVYLNGLATGARTQAVSQMVEFLAENPNQTPEQMVLALREASTHPEAGFFFKNAGTIDRDRLDTLRCMMSQCGKLLSTALEEDTSRGRASNEKRLMENTMLLAALWTLPPMALRTKKRCPIH